MDIREFVSSQVKLYHVEGHNKLLAATAGAVRCEQYVEEIVRRYVATARVHASMTSGIFNSSEDGASGVASELQQAITALSHQSMLLHLEIDSYYVFTKILLDRVAQLLHWWFANTRAARGISIDRHSEVVNHLDRLVQAGSLSLPDGLGYFASSLQRRLSDYRDHDVAHDGKHAFPGTLFDGSGRAKIVKVRLGTGVEGRFNASESEHIEDLDELRSQYVSCAMQFLINNRDKSKLASLLKQPEIAPTPQL